VKFLTGLPGLDRYPPGSFPAGSHHWRANLTCEEFQRIARTADELGFDAMAIPEHLALPVDLEANMGAYWPHAFTAMAFLAGATSRIKVNSGVIVLPYHHPVALAKAVSTLDVLSSGRVMLTFGVGMAPAEFAAVGVPFERRGRVTDEYVAAMKALWTEERPEFDGEFVHIVDVVFEPKPVQRPHPPLWFGGRSLASLRRAARYGDGWAPAGGLLGKGPWFEDDRQLPGLLAEVAETRAGAGNDAELCSPQCPAGHRRGRPARGARRHLDERAVRDPGGRLPRGPPREPALDRRRDLPGVPVSGFVQVGFTDDTRTYDGRRLHRQTLHR